MHLYLEHKGHIHLLGLLDKEEQEDLNTAQRKALHQQVDLRVSEIPAPPKRMKPEEIRNLRLHASQVVFANFLYVSLKAVQNWEQGIRVPRTTALRLLNIAKNNPTVLLKG